MKYALGKGSSSGAGPSSGYRRKSFSDSISQFSSFYKCRFHLGFGLVTVEASDGNNNGTLDVTVTVTDENEPPAFAEEAAAHSIAENTAAGQNIGTPVPATDQDAGDTTLTYTLGGDDAASFGIVATSGQLQTKAALDHETKPSYEVTVSVHDSKDASGNADTGDG